MLLSPFILPITVFAGTTLAEITNPSLAHQQQEQQQPLLPQSGLTPLITSASNTSTLNPPKPTPFYLIAHRVLTVAGVNAALSDGANALEIDVRVPLDLPWRRRWRWWPWKPNPSSQRRRRKWIADHDALPFGAGDSAEDMFRAIASAHRAGQTVNFVWLDIKTPDRCPPEEEEEEEEGEGRASSEQDTDAADHGREAENRNEKDEKKEEQEKEYGCSILSLRSLARDILEPVGVRVLYDCFYGEGRGTRILRDGLNGNEALAVDLRGAAALRVSATNANTGGAITRTHQSTTRRRIFNTGWFHLPWIPGSRVRALEEAAAGGSGSGSEKQFGRTFAWTVVGPGDSMYAWVRKFGNGGAGVDGLIYGAFALNSYGDPMPFGLGSILGRLCIGEKRRRERETAEMIRRWVEEESGGRVYLAGAEDAPW